MFSLVIALISITLVGMLAIVTMSSLGDEFNSKQSKKIDAATYLNQSQQIKGAINMYVSEHNGLEPADLNTLVSAKYLRALPDPNWQIAGNYLNNTSISLNQCQQYNKLITGNTNVPSCSDPNLPENICCQI